MGQRGPPIITPPASLPTTARGAAAAVWRGSTCQARAQMEPRQHRRRWKASASRVVLSSPHWTPDFSCLAGGPSCAAADGRDEEARSAAEPATKQCAESALPCIQPVSECASLSASRRVAVQSGMGRMMWGVRIIVGLELSVTRTSWSSPANRRLASSRARPKPPMTMDSPSGTVTVVAAA